MATKASGPAPAGRDRPASQADEAYASIRARIITLELPPGASIKEEAMAKELSTGRTPIREAVKRLALESLVSIYPQRGTFVSDVQITDLAAISEVRAQLESYAARLASERWREGDLDELRGLRERVAESAHLPALELMAVDREVHEFIYRTARNEFLRADLERYYALASRIWHLVLDRVPDLEANVRDHEELLDAIAASDGSRANSIAGEHVGELARVMHQVLLDVPR